ncbi:MAG TPA: flagellar basal-body rod protein FlgG [Candidatus Hydrogenedentes bacterium]|nr:flagellar basal-body rod protein FlgG [Candidatus Hydrogenedentota bacterium]HPG66637.1 flagellar basal-body rod protein FlgG [Candidatus Hydrogenedentota bacterium]
MIRALFTASTGMIAQQMNVDTIANNLANVNTTGFKKSRVNFQDLMYETIKPAGTETTAGTTIPEGIQIGHGVRPSAIAKLFTQGNFIQTGNPYDLVIEGDGFFQVELPDGTIAYTRDGSFKVNQDGIVMTADGYPLSPTVTVPTDAEQVTVGSDGTISATVPGNATPQAIATLQLVRFSNPAGLDSRMGRNLLLESEASGTPTTSEPGLDGVGLIEQGFVENSNVQVVEEILHLIIAQRAYEANSKIIQASDEMLQLANNVRR